MPLCPRATAPLLALVLLTCARSGFAEKAEKSKLEKRQEAYAEAIEDSRLQEGFLRLRQKEGKLYADLRKADLGRSFLFLAQVARGISAGDLVGGNMLSWSDEWVLEFRRVEQQVQVIRKNIRFTATEGSPMEEAVGTSFSDSVLASLDIVGEAKDGSVLVDLGDLLLTDLVPVSQYLQAGVGGGWGLDEELSSWSSVKVFPRNVELEAELTYAGSTDQELDTVPDPEKITLTLHYSLAAMPPDGYTPRNADPRMGHFYVALKDYSREDLDGPWVRRIYRWRLEKARPEAERSTVKQPLVFWLEKTIPHPWRPWIRQGVLAWNEAFARIGLLDAIEVRQQRDDADWEPEDIRYNTIRWTALPEVYASGPSHVNPITGEILDADIIIDHGWVAAFRDEVELFDLSEPKAALADRGRFACRRRLALRQQISFGGLALLARAAPAAGGDPTNPELPDWFVGAGLRDVVMHEVGHVLGLGHNFKASSVRSLEELRDPAITAAKGMGGSVMDYNPVNLPTPGKPQPEPYSSTLGPWDHWSIRYAYEPVKGDEEKALAAVASLSTTAELAYGDESDTLDDGYRAVDPLSAMFDLSSDPLGWAGERVAIVRDLWKEVLPRLALPGRSYTRVRSAVAVLLWELRNAGEIAARHVGGLYHHRDHRGSAGARAPFVPVPVELQRKALAFLGENVFADASYQLPVDLVARLAPSHWWHWGSPAAGQPLVFRLDRRILGVQRSALDRLLSAPVMTRLLDGERRAAPDADVLTLPELGKTLTAMLFQELERAPGEVAHTRATPYVSPSRRNLQRAYVTRLAELLVESGADLSADARLMARFELEGLAKRLAARRTEGARSLDVSSRAHLLDLGERIAQALEAARTRQGF